MENNERCLAQLAISVSKDLGFKSIDDDEIRGFVRIIQQFYSELSATEIGLAFDMMLTGHLDNYLPLDKNGQPDTSTYGMFSVAYITKILNAYKKKKAEMRAKEIENEPKPLLLKDKRKETFRKELRIQIREAFNFYKEHGVMPELSDIDVKLIYDELLQNDKIEEVTVEKCDTRLVYNRFRQKIAQGFVHWRQAAELHREQENHEDVQALAYINAMRRKIEERFKQGINDNKE